MQRHFSGQGFGFVLTVLQCYCSDSAANTRIYVHTRPLGPPTAARHTEDGAQRISASPRVSLQWIHGTKNWERNVLEGIHPSGGRTPEEAPAFVGTVTEPRASLRHSFCRHSGISETKAESPGCWDGVVLICCTFSRWGEDPTHAQVEINLQAGNSARA